MNIKPDNIPEELRQLPQWVSSNLHWDSRTKKYKRIPVNPITGKKAYTNNPATWGTFAQAVECSEHKGLSGIGFVLR